MSKVNADVDEEPDECDVCEECDVEENAQCEFYGEACPYINYYTLWPEYLKRYEQIQEKDRRQDEITIKDFMWCK